MKTLFALGAAALILTACGSTEKTVVEKQPIVVQQPAPVVINK